MEWYTELLIFYLSVVNLIGIIATVYDKVAARRSRWRISEKALLILSALGSGITMYITMLIIRHKTKHPKFMVGIPVIVVLELLAVIGIYFLVIAYG